MKQFIFFIFLILIFANLAEMPNFVGATGFSPSSLIFNLAPEETQCKTISISSTSEIITADDKWAENKNAEWKVNDFNSDASSLGISINYPSELSSGEREIEVCVSGKNLGEYHGVLLLKEEQQGNSIIQMGIWLKLIVGEISQQTQSSQTNYASSGKNSTIKNLSENISVEKTEIKNEISENKITGQAISDGKFNYKLFLSILVVLIIFILIIFFYVNYKKKRKMLYG